jgi:hypothetical protein
MQEMLAFPSLKLISIIQKCDERISRDEKCATRL